MEHKVIEKTKTHEPAPQLLTQYLTRIGKIPLISPEREQELARRIQDGCLESRNQLVEANLRLVVTIATTYKWLSGSFMEIISAGNTGLLIAAARYHPNTAAKFSTYAGHWIRRKIKNHVDSIVYSHTLRVPSHVIAKIVEVSRKQFGNSEKGFLNFDDTLSSMNFSPRVNLGIRNTKFQAIPIDAPADPMTGPCDSDSHESTLADPLSKHPAESLDQRLHLSLLNRAFKALSPRQQLILKLRFGLLESAPHTLEEVGQKLKLTRERVRQIERAALQMLRTRMNFGDTHVAVRAGIHMEHFNIYMAKNGSMLKSKKKGEPSYALQ